MIEKLQNFAQGEMRTEGEIHRIGVLVACNHNEASAAIQNMAAGIRSSGGVPFIFDVPYFGYLARINPMTAKYAHNFRALAATNLEALVKTHMLDGVVIISACEVTTAGLLLGTLKTACPVCVLPLGVDAVPASQLFTTNGGPEDITTTLINTNPPHGIQGGIARGFFMMLEKLGLAEKDSSTNRVNTGPQLKLAYKTGTRAVAFAKDLSSARHYLTKEKLDTAFQQCLKKGACVGGFDLVATLARENGQKIPHDFFESREGKVILVSGGACEDGGYVQITENTPINFSGRAWVYKSLEDADHAISNGAVTEGVVVLQNCADMDVSALMHTIVGMGHTNIALATDGLCSTGDILTITNCRPSAYDNESFANIQTGDVLEIDLAKGRFNTSIPSKDMKTRAKRGTVKVASSHF